MPAALSLRPACRPCSLARTAALHRRSATSTLITRALFGRGHNAVEQSQQQQQLPPAPVRRANARRSTPQQLVAAPGSSSSPSNSLSQRYADAPPLARGLIGAAALLAVFVAVKKVLGGGR